MNRICRKCNVEKQITDFTPNAGCTFGYTWTCSSCTNERNRARKLIARPLENRPRYQAKKLFEEGLKKCTRCEETKPLSEFWKCIKKWAGSGGYHSNCKDCCKERNRKWNETNDRSAYYAAYDKRPEVREKKDTQRRKRAANSPRSVMQITLRHGLQRAYTENPATIDDLMAKFEANDGRCAVTGIKMTWAQGRVLPTSISLDRIDHRQGYSADNIRLVCHAINAFKGQMTDEEMFTMALAMIANMKKPKLRLVS